MGFWYTQGFLDSGFSLFAYSNDDSRTDVIQMVKEYGGIEYEINLSEKEKGWYYVWRFKLELRRTEIWIYKY